MLTQLRRNPTTMITLITLMALSLPCRMPAQPQEATQSPQVNGLFNPDPSLVEAAAKVGQEAVKRNMTVDKLLKRWSKPVPVAHGYAIAVVPSALIAAAAFDAEKYHKDEAAREKDIAAALQRGKEYVSFRVVLRSKGSGTWLWPRGMTPGNRQALEAIKFVLADDQGHFYQPLDPEAQKRISEESKELGLPFSFSTYLPIGSWYLSLPFALGGTRQDFEARYEPTFSLKDSKGAPIITDRNRSFSLRVIGAAGEKAVEFRISELMDTGKRW